MTLRTVALIVGVLSGTAAAGAAEGPVRILHGAATTEASVVTQNEGGTGLTVHRGPPKLLPRGPAAEPPRRARIGRNAVGIDNLEPAGAWLLDRSGEHLVVVHCYTRESVMVGGNRKIRCSSRRF
ncbi:hypothetical protein [Pelagibius sp.]|uniref:hypothetical protein n=1 Tax=Pelagibius sp. TaxID=1931238 RepID=UPI002602E30E|nr:hypothetical protein [Pelagibius sp.]